MSLQPFRPFDPFRRSADSTGAGFDPDAADYFSRIVAAGSTIPEANKSAVNAFIIGCKADGIWSAIKASCILAASDTLAGALVPLVGSAPTNNGPFEAGDYSRTTGLVGDGSTKYLNANFQFTSAIRNNRHMSVFATERMNTTGAYAGTGSANGTQILSVTGQNGILTRCSDLTSNQSTTALNTDGFMGISRSQQDNYDRRGGGVSDTVMVSSSSLTENNTNVFRRNVGAGFDFYSTARLSFYSMGESLDLALLDARLTTLFSALA